MFEDESVAMRISERLVGHWQAGPLAAGLLCAAAATVAIWSGPLAAASHAFHTTTQPATHAQSSPVRH